MGMLANHLHRLEELRLAIRAVLSHFDRQNLDLKDSEQRRMASDLAFSDEMLFEKFRLWIEERQDDVLLFHIRRFFDKASMPRVPREDRDQSARRDANESEVKSSARERVKQIFSQRVTALALGHGLDTNEKLGTFLGVSEEQARKWRSGENKPQLATLRTIADKFKVRIEYLTGHSDTP